MTAKSSKDLSLDELRLLGEAVDNSAAPTTLFDNDYNLIYSNQATRNLWPDFHENLANGKGLEETLYAMCQTLFSDKGEEVVKEATRHIYSSFKSFETYEIRANDDRWIKFSHRPIGNQAIGGVGIEITDLKKKQKELSHTKTGLENLIETLEFGLLVIDDDGNVSVFNPAYQEYCHSIGIEVTHDMSLKDLSKKFIDAGIWSTGDVSFDTWFDALYKIKFANRDLWKREWQLPDGRYILRQQSYKKFVGHIITISDITDVKKAQLRAESAERVKSEFLANMSHEIRTPMNGILGMAQLLEHSDIDGPEKKYVKILRESSESLLSIVTDILDISKMVSGKRDLEEIDFNLRESLEDIVNQQAMIANEKNVELFLDVQADLPETYIGDHMCFKRIVMNLLDNALKFTETGHVLVFVTGEKTGHKVNLKVSIEDTGIGIPENRMDDIFEMFEQADGSRSRQFQGAGLGLSIAQQLANLLGGDIVAKSVVGKGSEFIANLNLPASSRQKKQALNMTRFERATTLVIVDNQIASDLITKRLASFNSNSLSVNSLDNAIKAVKLARAKGISFDFVAIDCNMMGENSSNFLNKVKALPEFSTTSFMILSDFAHSKIFDNLAVNEDVKIVAKPLNTGSLYFAMTSLEDAKTQQLLIAS